MGQQLQDNSLEPKQLLVNESLFAQGNGYLGVRGNFEEGYAEDMASIRGCYVNGFYENVDISYGEKCFGFPETMQKLPNIPDAQTVELYLGHQLERFSLFSGELLGFERSLDFDTGISLRKIHWRSPLGLEIELEIRRMVSFVKRELFVIDYQVKALNFDEPIEIRSSINASIENFTTDDDVRVASGHAKLLWPTDCVAGGFAQVVAKTHSSALEIALSSYHRCSETQSQEFSSAENQAKTVVRFAAGSAVRMTKYAVFTDTRRHPMPAQQGLELLHSFSAFDFEALASEQAQYLSQFWNRSAIAIKGDEQLELGLRFNVFQLLQSLGQDAVSNIAAKGLSGEGYEGHYFWDTEIYVLPVFILTQPELAKNLLRFRYNTLDQARARARELGHTKGALFPWRTINGDECSSFFEAGTAQYHISADIAWAFAQYWKASADFDFMCECGAEVLFETARLWLETGHFNRQGQFCIDSVTGPDEYTAIVNNNFYTNSMAQHNLNWAVKMHAELANKAPDVLGRISSQIGLDAAELKQWQAASDAMLLLFDESLGINPQDDSFLNKKVWDFENTPKSKYPLLLNFHPLVIYRHQVSKQPDVMLAHYLLDGISDEQTMAKSYDYYDQVTTHDSSLSSCIFSIMAARIGRLDVSGKWFAQTARLDLDNTHGNTRDGLHIANLAGTWQCLVYGFAGVRLADQHLKLAPALAPDWQGYSFCLTWRGRQIEIDVNPKQTQVRLLSGDAMDIEIHAKMRRLETSLSVETLGSND
ncbi:glycoside hydrolase family 65 protein [Alginatibacterium sediminis]|uniref:Glycoside hydrolase family 65 protein n=1 Tax=Alginatibacterium sediminis TaxID=2164068 RepID=A0A420E6H5_9ALTE|nr:glycosyl hydrolase family 65 protein [Alginatibacterium sediminis]RKF13231.1 glycoside hydrolase family 65 protein [Alginatibacterium sediminis]